MAVRVRKLAKELNRTPWDVLGVLHALGFDRYRSPDDMLPDPVTDRVRRASRDGLKPVPVPRTTAAPSRPTPRAGNTDLMSKLVPGVNRFVSEADEPPPVARDEQDDEDEREDVAPTPTPAPAPAPAPAPEIEALRAKLEADTEALAAERAAFVAERAVLEAEREALAAERAIPTPTSSSPSSPSSSGEALADVLAARGLRGSDEFERAIAALAGARLLGELVDHLRVDDPSALLRFLRERLVLVAGAPPEGLNLAAVTVAPERADLPEPADLNRRLARLGELLLLNGLRRVLVVGGRPAWQRLLREGVDARVEIRFLPPVTRTRADAENDVMRTDAVVLWGVDADAGAREVYATARSTLISVAGTDLPSLLDGISAALS